MKQAKIEKPINLKDGDQINIVMVAGVPVYAVIKGEAEDLANEVQGHLDEISKRQSGRVRVTHTGDTVSIEAESSIGRIVTVAPVTVKVVK